MFSGFEHTAIAAHDSKGLADWYIRMFSLQVVHDNGKTPPTYLLRASDGTVVFTKGEEVRIADGHLLGRAKR